MDDVYWKSDSCCNKVFHNLPTSTATMISYSQSNTDAVVSNCQLQWDIGLAQSVWYTATLCLTALVIFDKTVWNRIHLSCFMRNLNCEIQGFIIILSFYLGRAEVFLVCTNSSKTASEAGRTILYKTEDFSWPVSCTIWFLRFKVSLERCFSWVFLVCTNSSKTVGDACGAG